MKFKRTLLIKQTILAAFLILTGVNSLKAQLAQIPFEFNGTHLYIKVQTKNSDSLRFIFDTGATAGSMDSIAAEKAGISKENLQIVNTAGSGGVQAYPLAVHQNLKLKNIEIKDVSFSLVNFKSLSEVIGSKLDGIIGYEILRQYVTQIDFDHKKISFYANIQSADTTGYVGIPFEFSKNIMIPRFPITVTLANGEKFTGKVMFDTGNAFTLIVSTPFSKYHDFKSKLGETSFGQGRGMSAVTQDQLANINSMSFNGFNFNKMGVRLTVNDKAEPKDGYLGILGIPVIKRFNVILDYANKKIYLKPNLAYHDPFQIEVPAGYYAKESKAFLENNKTKPGVKVTASGLQYKVIKQGSGPKPVMTDRVSLNFKTTLINGQKLWSTYDDKKPWVHHLDKALPGVAEAALMMPAGSKWIVYIPAALAFGEAGYDDVPAGAVLIYELEVLGAEK